jgi:two-component system nitrate/nitrite response regulator NarL
MRLLICDYHVVFAESVAHLLSSAGHHVAGITHDPDRLLAALPRERADVCLLDVVFGGRSIADRLPALHAAAPRTRLVLLTAGADARLLATARSASVTAVADKRRPVTDLLRVLDRVAAGESVIEPERAPSAPVGVFRRPASDALRLAGFLTAREREVLCGLVRGDDTKKMARAMGIASATARCHIQNVLTKLGAHSRLEAATSAVRDGLVCPETGRWLAGDQPGPARRAG